MQSRKWTRTFRIIAALTRPLLTHRYEPRRNLPRQRTDEEQGVGA